LVKALTERKFTHVLALGSAVGEAEQASVLRSTKNLVVFATHLGPLVEHAAVVLPASSWAEGDGTFVNAKGKAQLSAKAISPQGDSRPAWELIAVLGRALGRATPWTKLGELRAAIPPKANPLSVRAGASA
jgi:NADH-quinone oxidoreductase subunit G